MKPNGASAETMDPQQIEERLSHLLEAHPGIAAAYLFGSVARGEHHAGSDVDVAILWLDDPPSTLAGLGLELEGELERELRRPVQVVVLNRAPVDLIHRVLRDGKLLVNADPSRRVAFEVKARNEYWDLLPVLRQYRRREVEP